MGKSAFDAFVAQFERRLMGYLTFVADRREDAEDLFQEVCVAAYERWGAVSRMNRPDNWIFRVAHNSTVNRMKRHESERRVLSTRPELDVPRAPDGEAERAELTDAVRRSMAALPEDQRTAVGLKIWGDWSWVEIGKLLGVSEDTAARLFARALRAVAPDLRRFMPR